MLKFPKEFEHKDLRRAFIGSEQDRNVSAALLKGNSVKANAIDMKRSFFALLYVVQGEGTFINSDGREYSLKAGDFVLRHPDRVHSIRRKQDGKWVEFAITFSRETYYAFTALQIVNPETDLIHAGINQQMLDRLCSFIHSLKDYTPKEYPQLMIEMQKLFYDVSHKNNREGSGRLVEEKIEKACIYLSENLDQKLGIPDYAERLGLGYHHFRKEFKKIMGLSPKEYRIKKRIEAAQGMIREDVQSLKEIASNLGYPDFASFAKQYKKGTGFSPSEFRKTEDL